MIKAISVLGILVGSFYMASITGDSAYKSNNFGDVDINRYVIMPVDTTTSTTTAPAPTTTAPTTSTTTPPVATTTTVVLVYTQQTTQALTSRQCGKEVNDKLKEYGLPINPFSFIAYRESRCNPQAINATWNAKGELVYALNKNKSWDSGLLQINSVHIEAVRELCGKQAVANNIQGLRDIDCNLKVAQKLYNNGKGIGHWRATNITP